MKQKEALKKFIKKRKSLVWYVEDVTKLGPESIVEHILNYGDWDDVQELIRILGIKKVAKIFWDNTSRKRCNYRPGAVNLFNHYFSRHA